MFHINCILLMIAGQVARTKSNNVSITNPANSNNTIAIGFPNFTVASYFAFQPRCYWRREIVFQESISNEIRRKSHFRTFRRGKCGGTINFMNGNFKVFCREFVNENGIRSVFTELIERNTPTNKTLGFYSIRCYDNRNKLLQRITDDLKVMFLSKYVILFISQQL